ncbi:RagB/SusD family nutrient uptake outer membrane protein [Myroides indicus]|uniref:SusD-like starch-binding protein associating with outer membrane n=1 Tax=Myroides indicus TaxID=1323422 RepID=A0A4R7FCQ8_9FLAO|nr:RagB/SusD family nutrient uptake outer membrane protein [Myroides indicus]TDS65325.1 SusD-like starch-binding protein associating with outer membrane [Myroides indicus]
MKKIMIIALGAGLLLGACSKDFLDTSSTRFISKDDIDKISETSPHLSEATMNGLYAYNVKDGSGGTDGHDDFGQKGYDIYTDMLSGDMNLNRGIYGWYSRLANLQDPQNYVSNTVYKPWRFYYYMVRGANNIIDASGGNEIIPEDNKEKIVVAQAKALRAYMYYNLVMLYTQGYDANEKILPIYITPSLANTPAKPTQEVFALMEKDLKEAISLFESAGANSTILPRATELDYYVTKGILAYVLSAKGTQDALVEVQTLTQDIMAAYPLATKEQLLGGFNSVEQNPNWIWGAKLGIDNNLDLVSWWGQVDVFTYSYAVVGDTKGMSKELYESIRPDDIRKEQFSNEPVTDVNGNTMDFGERAYLPINKFYSATGKRLQGQRLIESAYVFMRVEEMYLLHAEAAARLMQDGEAITSLKEMLANRIDDISYLDGLSGQALKDEIMLQTRIELWGEGKVYAAFKRNKKDMTYGSNHLTFPGTTFSYDDPRLTFKVPQAEILNNPVYNN